MITIRHPLLVLFLCLVAQVSSLSIDKADLFFGTDGGGHVFPGSTRPFGMVKMGIDVIEATLGDAYSGFAPDGKVIGVSMMHESGTGGLPQYGVVAQLPYIDNIDFSKQLFLMRLEPDIATPGYYYNKFTNGIETEFAAANRSGIYHYKFPNNVTPKVIVNGSLHLVAPLRPWWTQYFVSGEIDAIVEKDEFVRYTGNTTLVGGWGEQLPWTIYYCGEFDQPPLKMTSFQGQGQLSHSEIGAKHVESKIGVQDDSIGMVFEFPIGTREIYSKVGISFISTAKACKNIKQDFELGKFEFNKTVKDSRDIWNNEVFNKVSIGSSNETYSNWIYTSLYGAHLLPSDRSGENPGWTSLEPYYDDWFIIWDTFRCLNPLFNVLNPKRGAELVRSLVDIYRYDGFMPEGRSSNQNGRTQGGSNAEIVLADLFIKGIDDGMINWEEAFMLMKLDLEEMLPYVYDSYSPLLSTKEGRGGVFEWLEFGYVTRNFTRSVTRTMEYSYDDYAISVVALGLDKLEELDKFLKRSLNRQRIWNFNASTPEYNYTGFVQPKNADGTFNYTNYDPLGCEHCYWHNDEYEGTPVEYGWSVPHDIATLLKFIGSNETFIERLDDMFGLYGDLLADLGNEPSFLTPFLYNFVNHQYKTVETIRYLVNTFYSTGPFGLPGNSDAGAMQLWLFWSLIGIYPIAGTTTYLLSSPFVSYTEIQLGGNKTLEITANNPTMTQYYVQNVTVNGEIWDKNWVSHEDIFTNGGWIHFELGEEPVIWETGEEPPSPGHYSLVEVQNITLTQNVTLIF